MAAEPSKPETQKVSEVLATPAIPLSEIPIRATEASNFIRSLEVDLAPSPDIESIQKSLPGVSENIRQEILGTMKIVQGHPTFAVLQGQQELWQGLQQQMSAWMDVLTEHISKLREALEHLAQLQKMWREADTTARTSKASGSMVEQIDELLGTLAFAQTSLQSRLNSVLDLQSRVALNLERSEAFLTQIVQTQNRAVVGILARDGQPIWSSDLWAQARSTLSSSLRATADNFWNNLRHYFGDPHRNMPLHLGLFLMLSLLFWLARWRMHQLRKASGEESLQQTAFDRPFSAALIGVLFIATRPTSPAPYIIRQVFEVLMFVPMIRLVQRVIYSWLRPWVYALGFLFFIDTFREAVAGAPLLGQATLILETLTGILLLGRSLLFGRLRPSLIKADLPARMHVFSVVACLVLFDLAIGLGAGTLGYMRMAGLLTSGVVVGATFALSIYVYFRVISDVITFLLRSWPLRLLQMVQHHRDYLQQRLRSLLLWMAVITWVARYLDYVGLLDPILSAGQAVLASKIERGSISFSVDDVVAFILTVWAAYLLSAFIRFALREDVYPRVGIGQGVSYAISSLLNYVILALGVVVGMGLMGVDLSKVTVLAGAFGVGIGFGLQSVVNNFVCGLILLFERPIHVGDLVEVGDMLAEVRRIGIRASTVRTRHGADLIVPNSQLVTDKVTNWTLGDRLRRIQLPVGVNYGADPDEVIKLLRDVARNHPKVLAYPPARALFMSYGDSSINFELRAWTDEFLDWRYVRSDLAVAVYNAIEEAGMSFPFPQRDVHLLQDVTLAVAGVEVGESLTEPKKEKSVKDLSNVRISRSGVTKTGDEEGGEL